MLFSEPRAKTSLHACPLCIHPSQTEGREPPGEGLPTGLEFMEGSDKEDMTVQNLSSECPATLKQASSLSPREESKLRASEPSS